jgi:hypothetical protein
VYRIFAASQGKTAVGCRTEAVCAGHFAGARDRPQAALGRFLNKTVGVVSMQREPTCGLCGGRLARESKVSVARGLALWFDLAWVCTSCSALTRSPWAGNTSAVRVTRCTPTANESSTHQHKAEQAPISLPTATTGPRLETSVRGVITCKSLLSNFKPPLSSSKSTGGGSPWGSSRLWAPVSPCGSWAAPYASGRVDKQQPPDAEHNNRRERLSLL